MADSSLLRALDDALERTRQLPLDGPGIARVLVEARKLAVQEAEALAHAQAEGHNLAMSYTMVQRLFEELTPAKVCEAISEMAVNFIGSEDFVVYVRGGTDDFAPLTGMGRAYTDAAPFRVGHGMRGSVVKSGESVFGQNGQVSQTCMVAPEGTVVGYFEVSSLLRHKPRLTFEDRELISILRQRGGVALTLALERGSRPGPE